MIMNMVKNPRRKKHPDYQPLPTADIYDTDGVESESGSDAERQSANGEYSPLNDVPSYSINNEDIEVTKLKRNFGLLTGISMIVGNVIGSGIFISPKGVLMHSGSVGLSLFIWIICGLISMLGALSYAELGTSYRTSGGGYLYLYETIGEFPAFLVLWISALARSPTSMAIVSMTFANYLLFGLFKCSKPPVEAIHLISALLISEYTFFV